MNLTELKALARDKIEQAYITAELHYKTSFARPRIEFSNRLTSTAGKAYFLENKIVLSTPLLELNKDTFIKDTPGHEAAHLISFKLFGRSGMGHGANWVGVMRTIGQVAKRCHQMKTPKQNTVPARCDCMIHQLSSVRANKIRRGQASYSCNKCKARLELVTVKKVKPTKVTATTSNKISKAEIVRKIISDYKICKLTLNETVTDKIAIEFVMSKANLSKSLAVTYLTNNWNKVA